jgi:hypothetical protein
LLVEVAVPKRSLKLGQDRETIRSILLDAAREWFAGSSSREHGCVLRRFNLLEWADRRINYLAPADAKWVELIKKARSSDANADAALCGKAAMLIERGEKLPEALTEYISAMLYDRFFARAAGDRNALRDIFILNFVSTLERNGICPTRGDDKRHDGAESSGCSLVCEVLAEVGYDLEERGVEEVWSKRRSLDWALFGN